MSKNSLLFEQKNELVSCSNSSVQQRLYFEIC